MLQIRAGFLLHSTVTDGQFAPLGNCMLQPQDRDFILEY